MTIDVDGVVETRVIFKMSGDECVAFLVDCEASAGSILCYMHVGQHSEADIGFFQECRLATEEEYKDLREELESIGYRLYLRSRWNGRRIIMPIKKPRESKIVDFPSVQTMMGKPWHLICWTEDGGRFTIPFKLLYKVLDEYDFKVEKFGQFNRATAFKYEGKRMPDFPVPEKELTEFLEKFSEREFYSVCTGRLSGEFCYAEYEYSDDENIIFKLVWGINDGDENTTHQESFRISIEDFKNSPTFEEKYELCQSS